MGKNHYHRLPLTLERDGNLILSMTLRCYYESEILVAVNTIRHQEAYEAALKDGFPEPLAEEQGRRAEISRKTLSTLKKKLLERVLKPANALVGRQIFEVRLADLEEKRLKLELAERIAWEELGNADPEVIEVGPGAKPNGRFQRAGRADPRWMERIESLIWKQVEIGEKITTIRGALALAPPVELLEAAGAGDEVAGKGLKLWEARQLYSPEARAAGIDAEEANRRIAALSAYLEGKLRTPGGKPGEQGRVTFRVTVAEEAEERE